MSLGGPFDVFLDRGSIKGQLGIIVEVFGYPARYLWRRMFVRLLAFPELFLSDGAYLSHTIPSLSLARAEGIIAFGKP